MTEEREKRLLRLKRCRLFNSAYLFKRHLGGKTGNFSFFPLFLFYRHFPATWCFHFLYFKCCQKGNVFCFFFPFFFWWYIHIYILKKGGFKKTVAFCGKTNHEHSLGVFVKLPCMYSMHVNVVVQAWLQYI